MAQTQKTEKIIILNSSLDTNHYPDNTASEFTNGIYPIATQTYDSLIPMTISVPLLNVPDPPKPGVTYIKLNALGRKLFEGDSIKIGEIAPTLRFSSSSTIRSCGMIFEILARPRLKLKDELFSTTFDLRNQLDFFIRYQHDIDSEYQVAKDVIIADNDNNPHLIRLKEQIGNRHVPWKYVLNSPTSYDFNLELGESQLKISGQVVRNSEYMPMRNTYTEHILQFYNNYEYWNEAEIKELIRRANGVFPECFFDKWTINNLKWVNVPNIFERVTLLYKDSIDRNVRLTEADDNFQIYIHSPNIRLNRIANQHEPILHDLYITQEDLKNRRITENITIPQHIPYDLNSDLVSNLTMQMYNAVGEINTLIDESRSSVILCKLIKKYYDFSDGEKKTYITNLHTF